MAFLPIYRNFRVTLSRKIVGYNFLNMKSYLFQFWKSKRVTVFGSELHESHVGWVSKFCDNTETGKQPTLKKTTTTTTPKKHLHYTNNPIWYFFITTYLWVSDSSLGHKTTRNYSSRHCHINCTVQEKWNTIFQRIL